MSDFSFLSWLGQLNKVLMVAQFVTLLLPTSPGFKYSPEATLRHIITASSLLDTQRRVLEGTLQYKVSGASPKRHQDGAHHVYISVCPSHLTDHILGDGYQLNLQSPASSGIHISQMQKQEQAKDGFNFPTPIHPIKGVFIHCHGLLFCCNE